jgi:hypothetical protein
VVSLGADLEEVGTVVGRQPQSNLWAVQLESSDQTVWAKPEDIRAIDQA